MTSSTRMEKDSMGEMPVPAGALWGASTQRAVLNFPVSQRRIPGEVIRGFGYLKKACAVANRDLGKLTDAKARAIIAVCDEMITGKLEGHFPVDVFQTGSGTSTNMNVNEVIANRAMQRGNRSVLAGRNTDGPTAPGKGGAASRGGKRFLHPNDDVNMGQSSNDTFPTAMHIAATLTIQAQLLPSLEKLHDALARKAAQWDDVIKVGRTHLMDATPIRMGQVFSGYARQVQLGLQRAREAMGALASSLAIGGTAVGTGINTHPEFGRRVAAELSRMTGLEFAEAQNHFEAQASRDGFADAHGRLKTLALSLSKIASDIRWLGSGPRCGLGELVLPAIQPGSSIMPGKVNPVICESVMQVACRVIGNDAVITTADLGGVGSIFELNVAMPVMADAMLESIHLLANVSRLLMEKVILGLEVSRRRCSGSVEQSLMMVTSLAPVLGYDVAAKLAKEAAATGKTIRELLTDKKLLDPATVDRLLDARAMTQGSQDR